MMQRMTIGELLTNDWFKKGFKPPVFEQEEVTLDDVNSIFNESMVWFWALYSFFLSFYVGIKIFHLSLYEVWILHTGISKPRCGEAGWEAPKVTNDNECLWAHLHLTGSQPQFPLWKANGLLAMLLVRLVNKGVGSQLWNFKICASNLLSLGSCEERNTIYI